MDGRRLRRWCVCGGLAFGAVGCKHDQPTLPDGSAFPVAQGAKKSMWGGGSATVHPMAVAEANMPARKAGEPLKADTEVAFADVRVSAAFDEKNPPGNREALIDAARQGYQKALQQDPKNKGALLGMARLYARMGEQDRAVEVYRKYLALYPKDHATVHEVGVMHARWKDWASASAWCESAIKLDPENRDYRKTLGFCQARAGNWDVAFATLCQIMPEAKARHNLAGMLDQMGQPDACKQQLQYALQADPSYVAAREMLAELDQGGTAAPPTTAEEANPIRQTGGTQR